MKTIKKISVLLLMPFLLLITSCGKDGAIGPQGENGTTGPKGDPGPTGIPGTANVTQYNFAAFPHTGIEVQKTFALSKVDFEKSLLYVFVNPGTRFWYPLPGGTVGGTNQYRIYFDNSNATSTNVHITRTAGAGTENFTMRIIVIPAAKQVTASITHNQPDMKDYLAVAKYYGLPTE